MKAIKTYFGTVAIMVLVVFTACDRESDFELPTPSLIVVGDAGSEIIQEPGKEVILDFELQAASGLQQLIILKNNAPFQTIEFTQGEVYGNYKFSYTIPTDADKGAIDIFSFELTDTEGRNANYHFSVKVDITFSELNTTINGQEVTVIKGRLNQDYEILAARTYMIDSTFSVENNSHLTIEQGSTVYFKTYDSESAKSKLVITKGATINASGTAEHPIVFTSDKVLLGETPNPDDWGGIYVYGNAPTNEGTDVLRDGFRYGGKIANENSGTLAYIRIEYAGKDEAHALNLFGVGSSTRVHHIEVYRNYNIAFRIRGGLVSLKYIAAIGHGGYGLWADYGWQGNGQFWLFQTDVKATLVPVNYWNIARSIEMRNDDSFFLKEPRTTFKIANVTVIGNGYEQNVDNGTRRGIRIRQGATGILQNVITAQFPDDGVRVEDLDIAELGQTMILANTRSFDNESNYNQEAETIFLQDPEYNVTEAPVTGITTANFVGSTASEFNPVTMGNWFTDAPYIGAIKDASDDWTTEGNWFKALNGNIR